MYVIEEKFYFHQQNIMIIVIKRHAGVHIHSVHSPTETSGFYFFLSQKFTHQCADSGEYNCCIFLSTRALPKKGYIKSIESFKNHEFNCVTRTVCIMVVF